MPTRRSTPPAGRREANKAATRTAILGAARQLFAEQGFECTSVREIAAAAGVTERTFYRYFEGKEGLLLEEVVSRIEQFGTAIRERPLNEAPLVAVLGAIQTVLRAERGPRSVGSVLRLLETERPFRSTVRPSIRPLRRLEGVIAVALAERGTRTGQRDGATPTFEDEVVARVVVAAIRSAMIHHRALVAAGARSPGITGLLVASFEAVGELGVR
jgi:AcrR family transcriptional regulator